LSKQKIGEATLILAVGTLAVNAIQVVKLLVVSAWFGASTGLLDQYFIALNIPLAFQGVVVGALQMSFIPVYVGLLASGEKLRAQRLLSSTLMFGSLFFLGLCGILALGAVGVLNLAAVGFSESEKALNVKLFRLFLIMLFFNGLGDLLTAFYNANKRYFLPAAGPVGSIAISLLWIVSFPEQGVYALVYGLLAGSVFQLLLLGFGTLWQKDFRLGLSTNFLSREYLPIYAMMLPVGAGLLLGHTNLLIDQAIASTLPKGSVSTLNYATRLHDVVTKIFVLSIGGSLLPFLSQYVAEKQFAALRSTLALGLRIALLMLVPVAVIVWLFGPPTVAAVFQRGLFTASDSSAVGAVWAAYSAGLIFTAATIFQGRALNARRDLHPLWIVPAIGIPINIGLDILLARLFGVAGIALGTSIMYTLYSLVFRWRMNQFYAREGVERPLLSPIGKTVLALALMTGVALVFSWLAGGYLRVRPDLSAYDRITMMGAVAAGCTLSLVAYISSLKLLKVNEVGTLLLFAQRLFSRSSSKSQSPRA
jgi:putative peptidoglycan lipid II flippase